MAYTKKNTTKNSSTENDIQTASSKNDMVETLEKENKELKSQISEMQSNIKMLMEQITLMNNNKTTYSSTNIKDIQVVSLTNANLLLTTTGRSDGKHYNFTHQFDSQPIPETDLKEIVRAMPKTARNGYFYICDEQFVRENGLYSSYREILDKTKLENIFNISSEQFITTFKNSPKGQQSIIESMVVNKCINGEKVDANILLELKKITGKDYMNIVSIEEE